jgi:hypothetical protein
MNPIYSYLVGEKIDYLKTNLNYSKVEIINNCKAMKRGTFHSRKFRAIKFFTSEKEPIKQVLQLYQQLKEHKVFSREAIHRMKSIHRLT